MWNEPPPKIVNPTYLLEIARFGYIFLVSIQKSFLKGRQMTAWIKKYIFKAWIKNSIFHILWTLKKINKKNTGNYIQYSVMNNNGK